MAENFQVAYPITKEDGSQYNACELFELLRSEWNGRYLLSRHDFWHGGIHLSSWNHNKYLPIRAMADGEVIAYRVNETNLETTYKDDESGELTLQYSTGFCLIRHEYEVKKRKTAEEIEAEENASVRQKILDQAEGKEVTINISGYSAFDSEADALANKNIKPLKAKEKYVITDVSKKPARDHYFVKGVQKNKGEDGTDAEKSLWFAAFDKKGEITQNKKGKSLIIIEEESEAKSTQNLLDDIKKEDEIAQGESTTDKEKESGEEKEPEKSNKLTFYTLYLHLLAYDQYEEGLVKPPYWGEGNEKDDANDQSETPESSNSDGKAGADTQQSEAKEVKTKTTLAARSADRESSSIVLGNLNKGATVKIKEVKKNNLNGQSVIDARVEIIEGNVTKHQKGIIKKAGDDIWIALQLGNDSYLTSDYKPTDIFDELKDRDPPLSSSVEVSSSTENPEPDRKPTRFDDVIQISEGAKIKAGDIIGYMGDYDVLIQRERTAEELKEAPTMTGRVVGVSKIPIQHHKIPGTGKGEKVLPTGVLEQYKVKKGDNNLTNIIAVKTKEAQDAGHKDVTEAIMKAGIFDLNASIKKNPNSINLGQLIDIPDFSKPEEEKSEEKDEKWESLRQAHIELFVTDEKELKNFLDNDAEIKEGRLYIEVEMGALIYNTLEDVDRLAAQRERSKGGSSEEAEPAEIEEANFTHVKTDVAYYELVTKDPIQHKGESYYHINKRGCIRLYLGESDLKLYDLSTDGYIKKDRKVSEIFSQHDWRKMGFDQVEGDEDSHGYLHKSNPISIFNNIYKAIYRKNKAKKGKKLQTQDELQTALSRQNEPLWTKIIAKHPTEWQGLANKPNLNKLEEVNQKSNKEFGKKIFDHEKERVETLGLWNEVDEIADHVAPYHFHPIAFVENLYANTKKVCPIDPAYRSHFVIHSTAGVFSNTDIEKFKSQKIRYQGHKYIMANGDVIEVWPFTEKDVGATKKENGKTYIGKDGSLGRGRMFHVELNYADGGKPSEAQYQSLAELYQRASDVEGCWPIIVPHIEVDRGIADGHKDPENFDYNHFYSILRKKGIPIDNIPHFEHERYWSANGKPIINDICHQNQWPPALKGKIKRVSHSVCESRMAAVNALKNK